MSKYIFELAHFIAYESNIRDYSLWRMNKDIEYKIYNSLRNNDPILLDIVRMRAVIRQARELRRNLYIDKD